MGGGELGGHILLSQCCPLLELCMPPLGIWLLVNMDKLDSLSICSNTKDFL